MCEGMQKKRLDDVAAFAGNDLAQHGEPESFGAWYAAVVVVRTEAAQRLFTALVVLLSLPLSGSVPPSALASPAPAAVQMSDKTLLRFPMYPSLDVDLPTLGAVSISS